MNNRTSMSMVRVLVQGPAACFRRSEFTDDLITYDMMPPAVARRLLAGAYPLSNASWNVTRLIALNPIVTAWQDLQTPRGHRRVLALKNVAYVLEAQRSPASPSDSSGDAPLPSEGAAVHLGLPAFGGRAILLDDDVQPAAQLTGTLDLGWMPYSTERGQRASFFRGVMIDGVLDLTKLNPADLAS